MYEFLSDREPIACNHVNATLSLAAPGHKGVDQPGEAFIDVRHSQVRSMRWLFQFGEVRDDVCPVLRVLQKKIHLGTRNHVGGVRQPTVEIDFGPHDARNLEGR